MRGVEDKQTKCLGACLFTSKLQQGWRGASIETGVWLIAVADCCG